MQKNKLEIGVTYAVREGLLDFTGSLIEIYKDEMVLVQSIGTGAKYKVHFNSLFKI